MTLENITATVKPGPANADWGTPNNGWRVTLKNGRGNSWIVPFYMGLGLKGEPKALEVLESLVRDASSYRDARSFEEWAGDLGYDTDSRSAHKTYMACKRISDKLESFLTNEEFAAALEMEN